MQWEKSFLWAVRGWGVQLPIWFQHRWCSLAHVLIKGKCHGELKDILTTISNYKEEHVTHSNLNVFYSEKQGQLTIKQATAFLTGRWHNPGLGKWRELSRDEESWDGPSSCKVRSKGPMACGYRARVAVRKPRNLCACSCVDEAMCYNKDAWILRRLTLKISFLAVWLPQKQASCCSVKHILKEIHFFAVLYLEFHSLVPELPHGDLRGSKS